MPHYKLMNEILEKLEQYDHSITNKEELNISGFTDFLATNNVKQFESESINSEDLTSADRDKRLGLENTPATIDSSISQLIIYLYRYVKQYTRKALKNSELNTIDEFGYLATLLVFGQLSKIELISKNIQEKTTGMETIKRLLNKELISQFNNPTDMRSQITTLTDKGKTAIYGVFNNMAMVSKIATGDLTKIEKIQLGYLLKKLDVYHYNIFTNKKDADLNDIL